MTTTKTAIDSADLYLDAEEARRLRALITGTQHMLAELAFVGRDAGSVGIYVGASVPALMLGEFAQHIWGEPAKAGFTEEERHEITDELRSGADALFDEITGREPGTVSLKPEVTE